MALREYQDMAGFAFLFKQCALRVCGPAWVFCLCIAGILCGCSGSGDAPDEAGPRIVSLAPSLTEMVYAVGAGDRLVGRTTACNYPEAAKQIDAVGGFGTPSLERVAVVRPTVVMGVALADKAMARKMADLGLRYEHIPCKSVDDLLVAIQRVGELVGEEANARALTQELEQKIRAIRKRLDGSTNAVPAVYAEIWHDPIMTAGRASYVSEIIHLSGGRNIGDAAGRDYFKTASEWVVTEDPDVILCLYMGKGDSARKALMGRPGWGGIKAVRSGRVYDGLGDDRILRPSPRLLEGVESLRRCFEEVR